MNDVPWVVRQRHRLTLILITGAVYVMATVGMIAVPVALAFVGGRLVGDDPLGLWLVMAAAAVASFWVSRLVLCGLWWVRTGTWDWRRTRLTRSIRAGWGGPR